MPATKGGRTGPPGPLREWPGCTEVLGPAKPSLGHATVPAATVTNINDVLDGHVALEVECVYRLHLTPTYPSSR